MTECGPYRTPEKPKTMSPPRCCGACDPAVGGCVLQELPASTNPVDSKWYNGGIGRQKEK